MGTEGSFVGVKLPALFIWLLSWWDV